MRSMFRYAVPIDDQAYEIYLTSEPVAVANSTRTSLEFWAEHNDDSGQLRYFQVFGTGHPLPKNAQWIGTCPRTADGLVWHLYELIHD